MNTIPLLLTMSLLLSLAGCQADPKSGRGFTLPEGDADRGQEVFAQLHCYNCHSVAGVDLPASDAPDQPVVIPIDAKIRVEVPTLFAITMEDKPVTRSKRERMPLIAPSPEDAPAEEASESADSPAEEN